MSTNVLIQKARALIRALSGSREGRRDLRPAVPLVQTASGGGACRPTLSQERMLNVHAAIVHRTPQHTRRRTSWSSLNRERSVVPLRTQQPRMLQPTRGRKSAKSCRLTQARSRKRARVHSGDRRRRAGSPEEPD